MIYAVMNMGNNSDNNDAKKIANPKVSEEKMNAPWVKTHGIIVELKARVQAVLAPCLPHLAVLYIA